MADPEIPSTVNQAGAVVEDALRQAREMAKGNNGREGTPLAAEALLNLTSDRLFLSGFGPEIIDFLFYEMVKQIRADDKILDNDLEDIKYA